MCGLCCSALFTTRSTRSGPSVSTEEYSVQCAVCVYVVRRVWLRLESLQLSVVNSKQLFAVMTAFRGGWELLLQQQCTSIYV